jgi:hypothetical protein
MDWWLLELWLFLSPCDGHLFVSWLQAGQGAKLLNILAKYCEGNYWTMAILYYGNYVYLIDRIAYFLVLCLYF